MRNKLVATFAVTVLALTSLIGLTLLAQQDKYSLRVPGGLAFSEFRGYESWPVIAVSEKGGKIAAILGNSVMIDAYKSGIPGNGKPFPDGAKMAKILWNAQQNEAEPGQPIVPGTQHAVDFMLKDSKRFADSEGWGYAEFEYDAVSRKFTPSTQPRQGNDAKCGYACHTLARKRDFVFTEYGTR